MGFSAPNTFPNPNDLVDHWLPLLGEVELKVLLVIIRKTFGWHKIRDRISLSQMEKFTGSSRRNIIDAVESLQSKGLILKETIGTEGRQETYYELVIIDSNNSYQCQGDTGGGVAMTRGGVSPRHPQKTLIQNTLKQQQQELVVVVSPLIKSFPLSEDEKISLAKYNFPENRLVQANEFFKVIRPTKDLISGFIWHCKEIIPPKATAKAKTTTEKQKIIDDYIDFLRKQGFANLANENLGLMNDEILKIAEKGGLQQISLRTDIDEIKKDLKNSREYILKSNQKRT